MDKATFLVQLQKNIGMLDDDEQKDIIDEYSQHIDMKVSGGMTEAEAIEDFGDFNEFVRDVLNAYHVKAPFDQEDAVEAAATASPTAGDRLDDAVRGGAQAAGRAVDATKRGARKMASAVTGAAGKFSDPCEGGRFAGERGSRGGASGGGRIRRGGRSRRFGVPGCGRFGDFARDDCGGGRHGAFLRRCLLERRQDGGALVLELRRRMPDGVGRLYGPGQLVLPRTGRGVSRPGISRRWPYHRRSGLQHGVCGNLVSPVALDHAKARG